MAVSEDPRHGGADFGAPMTTRDRRFKRVAKLLVANGIISWFNRLEVVDHDKIPTAGPVIIAPSHRSNPSPAQQLSPATYPGLASRV